MKKDITEQLFFSLFEHTEESLKDSVEVFARHTQEFCGGTAEFQVIGWSHFIQIPSLRYYEILSSMDVVRTGVTHIFTMTHQDASKDILYETDTYHIKTTIWAEDSASQIDTRAYTLGHTFSNGAYTGILIQEHGYETVHAYPEFKKNVYTKTCFIRK